MKHIVNVTGLPQCQLVRNSPKLPVFGHDLHFTVKTISNMPHQSKILCSYSVPLCSTPIFSNVLFSETWQLCIFRKALITNYHKLFTILVSVKPKYGRMAMFRNIIPHSARPPSPDFHGTRYTFAVKVECCSYSLQFPNTSSFFILIE